MSRDPRDRIAPETSAEELRADLEKALRFIWRHNSGDSTEAARARAVEVIDLLTRHLRELGIERRLLHPLDDIHLAFAEARRGRSVPLFAPRPLKGRPPVELKKFSVMMKSALAIDLLIDVGRSRTKAADHVAAELRKLGFSVTAKTVLGWRDRLAKAAKSGHQYAADWISYGGKYQREKEQILRGVNADQKIDQFDEARKQLKAIASD
jgi:hypothetical protein